MAVRLFPETFEVFELNGCIEKDDGSDWTAEEGEMFWDDFCLLVSKYDAQFGGAFGAATPDKESA